MDSHGYTMPGGRWECIGGAGELACVSAAAGDAFSLLAAFHDEQKDWIFGHLGYDLKNEVEGLTSALPDPLGFPDLRFFVPRYVFMLKHGELLLGVPAGEDPKTVWQSIVDTPISNADERNIPVQAPRIRGRFSRKDYLETVAALQHHIMRGDCYEVTFCQEFYADGVHADHLRLYRELEAQSPHPHGAYYAFGDHVLCCASPERYLQLKGSRLLSQPMKGTVRRRPGEPERDHRLEASLRLSAKERSENVMIVDLVRNDLSRVCSEGSVTVRELYGIYPFPQVYQMISSVEGDLAPGIHWTEALKATFPMGSMTGAPKRRVMQLIEQYERSRRGLYSGALGYVDPDGNFDFGVVIRSILYNEASGYLSFSVGSAITSGSDPAKEYTECLVKAKAIKKALENMFPSAGNESDYIR